MLGAVRLDDAPGDAPATGEQEHAGLGALVPFIGLAVSDCAWRHQPNRAARADYLGPLLIYARFEDEADLRADLLREPPSAPICIAGTEVVLDYLEEGQFERLCRDLGGDNVDAISALPELPGGVTEAEMDRYGKLREQRNSAAQLQALRRYWHTG
jgi:hypothetical protein